MKSVHRIGKVIICAVYYVQLPLGFGIDEAWVTQLFPRAYGKNHTAWAVTFGPTSVSFYYLVNNRKQTTQDDLVGRIAKRLGLGDRDERIKVKMIAGVSMFGEKDVTGTSRAGTKHRAVPKLNVSPLAASEAM